jgi:hypothetical protein
MYDMGHIDSESPSDVMRWLQGESCGFVAGVSRLAELATQPVCARELRGLFVW